MPPRGVRLAPYFVGVSLALHTAGCQSLSNSNQTGPSGSTTVVSMSGTWRGTLEGPGLTTRPITLTVSQGGSCVDGTWRTEVSEWAGAISGYADASSFSGSFSLNSADGSGRCTLAATASGPVDATSIRWTVTGFTGSCPGGPPQPLTIVLRHD